MSEEGGDSDSGQEKSFEPTARRLEQARERGDVPRSTDINAAAAYIGLIVAVVAFGADAAHDFGDALVPFIGSVDLLVGHVLAPGGLALVGTRFGMAAAAAAALFLIPAGLVLAAAITQGSFAASVEKITPKMSKISPIKTAANKFGPTGLMEFAKSTTKMILISSVAWVWLAAETPRIIGLASANAKALPGLLADAMVSLLTVIAAIAVAIAAVDYLWQRYDHERKLRMSFEELKRDAKETDGDPYLRQARRQRAEEIATNQMLAEVPKADVVIVNPEHYAVALTWSKLDGSAPVCVAKGVDEIAAAIRARAAEAGVPIHRDPPTARSLHALVEIGAEIAPEHYKPVAAAIRFAMDMRRRAKEGIG